MIPFYFSANTRRKGKEPESSDFHMSRTEGGGKQQDHPVRGKQKGASILRKEFKASGVEWANVFRLLRG